VPSVVVLTRARHARLSRGHPWIFDNEVDRVEGDAAAGDIVAIRDARGRALGWGLFHPRSKIRVRRLGHGDPVEMDAAFFGERIARAWALRERELPADRRACCRVVSSEADGLSGLVVDRYRDRFVVQVTSFGMERRVEAIGQALGSLFDPSLVWLRNDAPVRALEGLGSESRILSGSEAGLTLEVEVRGLRLAVDLRVGHKGGLYLDQLDNQALVAARAGGRAVLDCFSYQGGFALAAAKAGAARVTAVEISAPMCERIARHADTNGVAIDVICANAFDFLRGAAGPYDLVVLDPPSFTKSKAGGEGALRGYKEIHLRALKLLSPGGLLATFTCSAHVDRASFEAVVVDAAMDARRPLRRLRTLGQPGDHPVLPHVPETEYLKGALYEALA
jgi:23S rRNA (cytosine1962-C5)-methyltransferase